jgi:hypothetical protein
MAMPRRDYNPKVERIAREALKRGALIPTGRGTYIYGIRTYGAVVVNRLIATGEAQRLPDGRVVQADAGA